MTTLQGRHAVITGGGSGIGLATAARLQAEGARLTLMGRTGERLERARERLSGGEVHIALCDVTDADRIAGAFEAARRTAPVDILINNAGAAEAAPFLKTSPELWRRMLDVNLTGAFLCSRAVLEHMRYAEFGRIVN
ncbi:MAG: SDR family NAD(P)-dependent oxidoreductase, partial [Alphaproteobacteria bacterium]